MRSQPSSRPVGSLRCRRGLRNHARGQSRDVCPWKILRPTATRGVNRLSFGVQSFRDDELRRLSRLHGADRARAAYREARAAGFDNVSLDLMMWLPGQQVGRVARIGRRGHRPGARASLAVHARGLSERAAQGRDGARRLVAGARRRCGRDVRDGDGTAGGGRLRAVRDFECRRGQADGRGTT